jgi:N-carbamoyl-L-amino-acid hydrolase
MTKLSINSDRLWNSIHESAQFGDSGNGGICRLALDEHDKAVRDWFRASCEQEGCDVFIDELGSMFAVRKGRNASEPYVGIGSHLDTQPTGGRFDGILGVCAGLEVIRAFNDARIETDRSICVVNWTNEEGSRFQPGMMASGVFAGSRSLDETLASLDRSGVSVAEALERINYRGRVAVGSIPLGCFLELHIEQGPYLEAEGVVIGVVEGAYGLSWYNGRITGTSAHAGATPMTLRRDAFAGLCDLALGLERIACRIGTSAVATIGEVTIASQSRNTIPGDVSFTIDARIKDAETTSILEAALSSVITDIKHRRGVEISLENVLSKPAARFDTELVDLAAASAELKGYSSRRMLSGGGHDACHLSSIIPTAMIFVPCRDGISHNEVEFAEKDHCLAGASVLLQMVTTLAGT